MISQKSIQEVLDIAQVEHIIEEYVTLKKRGANMLGLCPFHDEKTPSFTVSPSKNIYKCFGCGKGGGAVQFLMEHDSVTFPEAIRTLAKKYNITLEEDKDFDQEGYAEQKKAEDSYYIVNEFAAKYYKDKLINSNDGQRIGLSYFKERGFNGATIDRFDLGFSIDAKSDLTDKARKAQYKDEFLTTLGLTSKSGYDFFRNRVMFPIHNLTGKVIGFAGRTLSTGKSQPKYINSPETPIYNKRKVLYAMHLAKNAIKKKDNCFIVEGYTDVISLFQNGVENVVASSGTSLTKEQVRLVKRYTNNITFLYDGDQAGIKASMRGLDIVLENDMNVQLVMLPEGEDPDSFIKASGNEKFETYVKENSKDFIFFKMDNSLKEVERDPIKKAEVINDIISSIAKIRDAIKRSLYIKECSHAFEMEESLLVRETNKVIKNQIKKQRIERERAERRQQSGQFPAEEDYIPEEYGGEHYVAPQQNQQLTKSRNKHEYQEKDLARIIVTGGHTIVIDENQENIRVADLIYSNISDVIQYFNNPIYKQIIEEGFKNCENPEIKTLIDYFVNHSNSEIRSFAIDSNSTKYEYANWEEKEIILQTQKPPERNFYRDSIQSIFRFKLKKIDTVLKELGKKINGLNDQENNEEAMNIALETYKDLSEVKKELANKLGTVIPGE